MGTYRSVAQVDVMHPYFRDGHCRHVRFLPSLETTEFLNRFGLLLRANAGGVELLADTERLELLAHHGLVDRQQAMSFLVGSTDPLCQTYTSMPTSRVLPSITGLPDGSSRIEPSGSEHAECEAWRPIAPEDLSSIRRSAAWTPLARFRIPLAVVWPEHPGSLPERRQNFRVCLDARRSIWKYLLFGDYGERDLRIVDAAKEVAFDAPETETLPDDSTVAVAIRSASVVPLSERPPQRFQLIDASSTPLRVMIRRLPAAAPGHMHRETVRGKSVIVSEIYVNR